MMHGHEKSDPEIVAIRTNVSGIHREAGEQCGAIRGGAGGAKGRDQGECGPAKHAPGSEPGRRVTGAGAHTASRKAKKKERFTALLHHVNVEPLRLAFASSKRTRHPEWTGRRGRTTRQTSSAISRNCTPGSTGELSATTVTPGVYTQGGRSAASTRGGTRQANCTPPQSAFGIC